MNVKTALNLDVLFDGVVPQFTHRIGENGEAIGHTCVNEGFLIYLKVFHFKTNLRYENCDRPTVKSSVEIIP